MFEIILILICSVIVLILGCYFIVRDEEMIHRNCESEEAYINNARAKKIQVTINNETVKIFELKDTKEVQLFDLNYKQTDISKPINVKIEVLEIYEGKETNDVYIIGEDC